MKSKGVLVYATDKKKRKRIAKNVNADFSIGEKQKEWKTISRKIQKLNQ